jgi:protein phosphatase
LTHCRVSPESIITSTPVEFSPEIDETDPVAELEVEESEFAESSQPHLDLDLDLDSESEQPELVTTAKTKKTGFSPLIWLLGLILLLATGTGLGLFAWWRYSPATLEKACNRLPQGLQRICPKN